MVINDLLELYNSEKVIQFELVLLILGSFRTKMS